MQQHDTPTQSGAGAGTAKPSINASAPRADDAARHELRLLEPAANRFGGQFLRHEGAFQHVHELVRDRGATRGRQLLQPRSHSILRIVCVKAATVCRDGAYQPIAACRGVSSR